MYVTHDQVEALALGDRLAIMRAGALEQFDTPEQVFEQPATDYVAAFIGMGNRLELERRDGRWTHDGVPIADLNLDSEAERLALRSGRPTFDLAPPEASGRSLGPRLRRGNRGFRVRGRPHGRGSHDRPDTRPQSDTGGRARQLGSHARAWPACPRVDQATRRQGFRRRREAHPVGNPARLRSVPDVTTGAVPTASRRRSRLSASRTAKAAGILAFVLALGYLSVLPLIKLQIRAFGDGGQPYRDAFSRPGQWDTVRYTLELGLGALAIAMVLGTYLAWAASVLPPRSPFSKVLPIFPIILPAVSAVVGWVFLLSPVPGFLNEALRWLPWWSDRLEGPFDIYTLPFIMIITGLSLASFVVPVCQRGLREHQRRVDRGSAGSRLLACRRLLQGHPAPASTFAHLWRRAWRCS